MNQASYQHFTIEEFATDPYFREWTLNPTEEHEAFWQAFNRQHPEKHQTLQDAQLLIKSSHSLFGKPSTPTSKLYAQFDALERKAFQVDRRPSHPHKTTSFTWKTWAIAASVLFLISSIAIIILEWPFQHQRFETAYGEWKTVNLPDSSVVKLNANSSLTINSSWEGNENREVWLEGEAYFAVSHQPSPHATFTVRTNGVSVQVLGTRFNVNSRNNSTEVFLEEGKVRWIEGKTEKMLEPGDLLSYTAKSGTQQQSTTKIERLSDEYYSSWKDGVLVMSAPTHLILERFTEIYGIEFEVLDTDILEEKNKISIPMDKLALAIPIMEKTLNVTIRKKEDQFMIARE